MIVFKNYFKVAKPFLPMIIIYTCIFVAIATITSTNGIQTDTVYQDVYKRQISYFRIYFIWKYNSIWFIKRWFTCLYSKF